jgi:phosphate-selective porin OprO and OprP
VNSFRLSVSSLASLAGLFLAFPQPGTAQNTDGSLSSKPTHVSAAIIERLEAIERQLNTLERRVELVERSSSTQISSSPSQEVRNGEPQAVALANRVETLDQQLRTVERRRELEAETAMAQAKTAPVLGAGPEGFFLRSSDNAFRFSLRGQIQADGRFANDATGRAGSSTFGLGSIRPIIEGSVYRRFAWRLMPDFGGGTTVLQEAWFDATVEPWLKLKIGKFKGPVGLERLQTDSDVQFYDRSMPTKIVPNREVGVQLYGDVWGGVLTYATGLFNGVPDGASADLDSDNKKEFEGRIFTHPFRSTSLVPLQGLGMGIGGTYGKKDGSTSAPAVAPYRTSAQQTFFRYRSDGTATGTVLADGAHSHITPQLYYYFGPFGMMTEYVLSSQDIRRGALRGTAENAAWQVATTYVVTGDRVGYTAVFPDNPLGMGPRYWGALELTARYGELRVDKGLFPVFADPQTAAAGARAWTLGFNWYFSRNAKFVFNYERTNFTEISGSPGTKDENAFLQRFQIAF